MTFERPKVVRDVIYRLETSTDLSHWVEAGGTVTMEEENGIVTHAYRDGEPIGMSGRRFLRLRVEGDTLP